MTSSSITIDGTSKAGEQTKFSFSFKTSTLIPFTSFIMLSFPKTSGFTLSKYPSCQSYKVGGLIISGVLKCETIGTDVIVRGKLSKINNLNL